MARKTKRSIISTTTSTAGSSGDRAWRGCSTPRVWVVNGEVFKGTYESEGTAAAGGNGKYGDMDGNEEHVGNGGY